MYKLIDRQGMGTMARDLFLDKDAVRDRLRSFHSPDVEGAEKMSLNDLLEIGDWELEEVGMVLTREDYELIWTELARNEEEYKNFDKESIDDIYMAKLAEVIKKVKAKLI